MTYKLFTGKVFTPVPCIAGINKFDTVAERTAIGNACFVNSFRTFFVYLMVDTLVMAFIAMD